ncbi:hypothetical protein K470DRAFT_259732 [Piedraia hortae CBS 480.64]|uniref:DUF7907 domain-containing protein n=1 Tax=Piedraia hortae CBS 480.64 TaxID=1314780 RepID=A0A6A7BTT2_9PEZI|nr:hypothetical protein K470DRAFT_259732 [Piedraia hortae CBS 480.64]
MKTFSLVLGFLAALVTAQFNNQSANFFLVVDSKDDRWAGTALGTCHEGAAIESLCPGHLVNSSSSYQFFQFNTSDYSGDTGLLTYELHGANINVSEPMSLSTHPLSNLGMALFIPNDDYTGVAFDECGKLNIEDSNSVPHYRWYICHTRTNYDYWTLSWLIGNNTDTPDNPTCTAANITRVFAHKL